MCTKLFYYYRTKISKIITLKLFNLFFIGVTTYLCWLNIWRLVGICLIFLRRFMRNYLMYYIIAAANQTHLCAICGRYKNITREKSLERCENRFKSGSLLMIRIRVCCVFKKDCCLIITRNICNRLKTEAVPGVKRYSRPKLISSNISTRRLITPFY